MEEKPSPRKPGILVRGIPPDKSDDYEYTLELYFDKFGTGEESVVKEITVCEDKTSAYVEFKDPAGERRSCTCIEPAWSD